MLEQTRARTLELVEPLSDDALNAVHDPLMSPIVWDLGHIANFEELWLVRTVGGRPPLHEELAEVYDPSRPRAASAASCPTCAARTASPTWSRARAHAGVPRGGRRLRRCRPPAAGGFVYELIAAARAAALGDDPPDAPDHDRARPTRPPRRAAAADAPTRATAGGMVLVAGRPVRDGRRAPTGSPTTTSAAAHVVELAPFWIDAAPVTNGEMSRVHRGRRLRAAANWWSDEGWEWRQSEQAIALPRYWQRDGDGFRVRSLRPARAARSRSSPSATSPGTRPTPTRATRASGCRPRPSGRRRRRGTRPRARSGRYPWGDERADAARANLDQLAFGTAAGRRLPRRREPLRRRSRCWATSGSGPRATSTPTRASRRSPTASTRRLLRRPLQGAARRLVGDAARAPSRPPFATGTIPSGARSSPAFAARATRRPATSGA